jgi:hypothetical protein
MRGENAPEINAIIFAATLNKKDGNLAKTRAYLQVRENMPS